MQWCQQAMWAVADVDFAHVFLATTTRYNKIYGAGLITQ